ncbi:CaiB/BaiF CoA transferase family protein [Psychromarinibacter halotolerans]|uniref:CaiB/BaiF CoA transferase family protein n=1 Tax=Psychromarinibacter halotolerans TaxID=1775175 RepID=A0ABV7GVN9_9RHOB|nr:CoA transferase [Psychromarinibacter halotolerans]MDF0597642.1 CoA transferase [Psychromarinibacter halotolerans]
MLSGLTVIDHGTFITGSFATMLLADLGATVIKVEKKDVGDPYRSFRGGLYAPHFQANNRSKQSIGIDLNDDADREVLLSLIDEADVYVQNFRPGVAEKLGLSAETLQGRNPKLIYCSISGFGPDGPLAARPTYDTVAQGMSGFLSMYVGGDEPRIVGPAIADSLTGLYAAYGILGAIAGRERTGKASKVDLSMLETVMHFASEPFANFFGNGKPWGPYDRASISQSYSLECADGSLIALHLSSPEKFWTELLAAIERPDLNDDPRFDSRMKRVDHHDELIAELRPVFVRKTRDEWSALLDKHDVPFAPIYTLAEALEGEQAKHLEVLQTVTHPEMGEIRMIRNPITYDGDRRFSAGPPPTLDEHGAELRDRTARKKA